MKLSVLICTIPGREKKLAALLAALEPQAGLDVEILVFRDDCKQTIGAKRNALLSAARGLYVAFVDDDDLVTHNYVSAILTAIETVPEPDVVCFDVWVKGYENKGLTSRVCRYDPSYTPETLPNEFRRRPNHLMAWRRSLAARYRFSDVSMNEDDSRAARMVHEVETVARIEEILYTYQFDENDCAALRGKRPTDALIAVLVPVLNRPGHVAPLLDSLAKSTSRARAYFLVNEDDHPEIEALEAAQATYFLLPASRRSWAMKINEGLVRTTEPWLLLGADDLKFHAGWVEEAERLMTTPGVIGTNDLGNPKTMDGTHSTHPIVARDYADRYGTEDGIGICHEGYHHNFPDTELVATAAKRAKYRHAYRCVIEHMHPAWGKSTSDSTYQIGQQRVEEDRALFHARAARFLWPALQGHETVRQMRTRLATSTNPATEKVRAAQGLYETTRQIRERTAAAMASPTTIAAYTALYGDPGEVPSESPEVRTWIVNDERAPHDTRPLSSGTEFAKQCYRAKHWRMHPELIFPDHEVTVWVDASFEVIDPDFPKSLLRFIEDADVVLQKHPWRDCIYDELDASLGEWKYHNEPMIAQVQSYRAEGWPQHAGLFETGLLIRRNNPAGRLFNEMWWAEIQRWSIQDQLSLPRIVKQLEGKVRFKTIGTILRDERCFRYIRPREYPRR